MALDLRANTAVDVLIGPFVDSTDGDTDETGLTISQADVKLSKNGQALAQKNDNTACVHDADGYYNCELDATDTNTEGQLVLKVHESGALNVRHEFNVLSEAAWDSMYVAKDTGYMDVNVKAVSEDTTAADNLESACDNYSVTRGLTGTALPAAAADAAGGLPISDAGGLDLDTYLGRITGNVALASVVGALADAAAAGEVTEADTLMQYIKQLINILIGTPGIATFPAEAAPGNAVSLAEVIRAIHADVTGLNGDAMRGTDSAATAASLATTDGKVDTIDTVVDGIQTDLDNATDGLGALKALIDALNDISAADVNAQVLDVLNTDTFAEPGDEAPTATTTLVDKIGYLYKFLRNKIETTSTRIHVYDDAGTNKDHSSIISDDGTTFTRGEFGAGDA